MDAEIILVIIFVSFIQSIFGVGILLFGTPLLIILNHSFIETLTILLPISVLVNFFQIFKKTKHINFNFYKKLILITIPLIVLSLFVIGKKNINIEIFVGLFLIIISLNKYFSIIDSTLKRFNENIFLISTGIIHGMTNLGGALLSAIVINKDLSKQETRTTIAICYLTFAIFQIFTLKFALDGYSYNLNYIYLCFIGVSVYYVAEKSIFRKIKQKNYITLFNILLFSIGVLILTENLI
tara:strand:- start:91 stop:807 length:717 start_codon:yes stop_codon:yes gene_type:complete